ncbi:MAG: hypothetical protein EXQ58_11425 [Acidobacteria bacterium]|nr:hypothetical protein [Acidobacteriota bacterium]
MKPKHEFIVSSSLAIAFLLLAGHFQGQAIFVAGPQATAARPVVPAEFIGDWVPASATCASPARFRAEVNRFTLINGQDSASYGDLHMATSEAYFGPGYSGISKVVMPDSNKNDPPFMAFFNHNEKKGVALLDIDAGGPQPARSSGCNANGAQEARPAAEHSEDRTQEPARLPGRSVLRGSQRLRGDDYRLPRQSERADQSAHCNTALPEQIRPSRHTRLHPSLRSRHG